MSVIITADRDFEENVDVWWQRRLKENEKHELYIMEIHDVGFEEHWAGKLTIFEREYHWYFPKAVVVKSETKEIYILQKDRPSSEWIPTTYWSYEHGAYMALSCSLQAMTRYLEHLDTNSSDVRRY